MLSTQLFNVYKFDGYDSSKATSQQQASGKSDKITLVAGNGSQSGTGAPGQQQPLPVSTLAYSHNNQILCVALEAQNQYLVLARASDGAVIAKQDTHLNQYSSSGAGSQGTTRILAAAFSSADSSKIAFTTSEGSLQGKFGGHLVIVNMVSKQIEKVYREPFLSCAGVTFNTNDSMIATGNSNGDVILRNLQNPEGAPLPKKLDLKQPHESGISEVILSSYNSEHDRSEVTLVRFSVVKRHILASAYKNGQVIIWDVQGIFTKAQTTGLSQACKKFVFAAHDGRPCTGIAFSQVNHLLLASCGVDAKVHFYDITQGKEVKKIDVNQNSSSNVTPNQIVNLAKSEHLSSIAFCADGCTIAVGTSTGRIVAYNLKDVKRSKCQLQAQTGRPVTSLAFQRPIKSASKGDAAAAGSASEVDVSQASAGGKSTGGRMGPPRQTPSQGGVKPPGVGLSRDKSPAQPSGSAKQNPRGPKGVGSVHASDSSQNVDGPSAGGAQETFKRSLQEARSMIGKNTAQNHASGENDSKNEGDVDSMDVDEVRDRGEVKSSAAFDRKQGNLKKQGGPIPPLNLAENEGDAENAKRLPLHLRKEIDKMLDQQMAQMKHAVAQKMHNIHLDLIRQMVQQEGQVEDCLQTVAARNKEQKQIIKQLKEENEKLRKIQF